MRYIFLFLLLVGCNEAQDDNKITALFLGHPRAYTSNDLKPAVKHMDLDSYDLVLLGGDLMPDTTSEILTLFETIDVRSERVLWAPGNHDYSYPSIIMDATGRDLFYSYDLNGTTFIVLDTEISGGNIEGYQLGFLEKAVAGASGNIVVIHHKMIWLGGLGFDVEKIANSPIGDCSYCLPEMTNFFNDVYPLFENAPGQVIFIGGDMGNNRAAFEFVDSNGIVFLGSGMGDTHDSFLELEIGRFINWKFLP